MRENGQGKLREFCKIFWKMKILAFKKRILNITQVWNDTNLTIKCISNINSNLHCCLNKIFDSFQIKIKYKKFQNIIESIKKNHEILSEN